MSRKTTSKGQASSGAPTPPASAAKGSNALIYAVIAVLAIAVTGFAIWGGQQSGVAAPGAGGPATATQTGTTTDSSNPSPAPSQATPSKEAEAAATALAAIGPHKQAVLPPIPFQGYAPQRPVAVVTAAYEFAAEHPEILSYIPCFCGCERGGHRGNHDCFVKARAANGDVVEWEPHGLECAVCLDVATRSRQMHASGASVRDIRTAIEKEFVPTSPVMTPTPKPPAHDH